MSDTQEAIGGPSVELDIDDSVGHATKLEQELLSREQSPPPQYPSSEASGSSAPNPRPPPFSSLYRSTAEAVEAYKTAVTEAGASASVPAYAPVASEALPFPAPAPDVVAETKAALPKDTKGESSKEDDESEPPPAYSEGSSPLESFTYVMAAAGGAASIITQVQQGGPPPINTLGGMCEASTQKSQADGILDVGVDENITMDLRYDTLVV